MGKAKLKEIEMLVMDMFEKAEDMIEESGDPGEEAAEFLMALTNCLGIFHDSHYPQSAHELLMKEFAATVVEKARMAREYEKDKHIHISFVIEINKK